MGLNGTNQLRLFESTENLKRLLRDRTGLILGTGIAQEIAACIQQGREFYEAAESSPLGIRPLQQFYGMVSFAKALIVARRFISLSTLRHGHGLKDISDQNSVLAALRARIEPNGTFCEFNAVVSSLNRMRYIDADSWTRTVELPTASSDSLAGMVVTLKDVFARIPFLSQDYFSTFGEESLCTSLGHLSSDYHGGYYTVSVVNRQHFTDRASLALMVDAWRNRFPYLNDWRLIEARLDWGYATIKLANLPKPAAGETSEKVLVQDDQGHFHATDLYHRDARNIALPIEQCLKGVGGGFTTSGNIWAISPLHGQYVSEYSFQYLGLFILSSLVRYRPDAWIHAVTRSSRQDRPSDDQCLALIERFLQLDRVATLELLVRFFNVHEDR